MRNYLLPFVLCCQVALFGQTPSAAPLITIRENAIKVEDLLAEITRQSGAHFTYNSRVLNADSVVAFQVRQADLHATLERLSERLQVTYRIVEGQVILNFAPRDEPPPHYTLSGFLSDQATGETLIGAAVTVNGTGRGVVSNEFGYYALTLPGGDYAVKISYLGYGEVEHGIALRRTLRRDFQLPPATIGLPAVVVRPEDDVATEPSFLDRPTLRPEALSELPEFAGESGLVKGLQTLPGLKMHGDGSAFFYARGGERDQNVIIIDDAPIFNPSHMLGFYSLVIPDFAKDIQVYKSDMPASLGDRLSSIVSIRTKDGNLKKARFSGALNPFVNRFSLETPLAKERSALFLSVRRSNYEWLYRNDDNAGLDLYFQDFQFKWNYKLNPNNRLFLTVIQSGDVFENAQNPRTEVRWGNLAGTLRWNHLFNARLFANTTLYTGNYVYNFRVGPAFWQSQLSMLSLKTDFTYFTRGNGRLNFGFETQAYFNNPGGISTDPGVSVLPELTNNASRKAVFYYQGRHQLTPRLTLNMGARLVGWENHGPKIYFRFDDAYQVSDTLRADAGAYNGFINFDPRLSLDYRPNERSGFKFSFGTYHQYLQLISNTVSPFTAFEVWLPAGPTIQPQSATQWAFDYHRRFPAVGVEVGLGAYHKKMRNQIDYAPFSSPYLNPLLEGDLRFGTARGHGLELMINGDFGRLSSRLSYTYSRVFRTIRDINAGREYPAFQDRPHDFSVVVNYELRPRIRFTANWISQSGSRFTSPTGYYTFNEQRVPIYGTRNNDRLPTYHRLDVAWRFVLNKDPANRYRHSLTFSIYNALAHENVFAVKFNKLRSEDIAPRVSTNVLSDRLLSPSQIDLVRFFPSLTYKFRL